MTTFAMIFLIYLMGYAACYLMGRYHTRLKWKKYTVWDRSFLLTFSISSWFGVFVILLFIIGYKLDIRKDRANVNEPASW